MIRKAVGGRVEDPTQLFGSRDALNSDLFDVVNVMETQIKGSEARNGEGDVRIRTGTERKMKMKVERTPLLER